MIKLSNAGLVAMIIFLIGMGNSLRYVQNIIHLLPWFLLTSMGTFILIHVSREGK
jgi:hypothetical protein